MTYFILDYIPYPVSLQIMIHWKFASGKHSVLIAVKDMLSSSTLLAMVGCEEGNARRWMPMNDPAPLTSCPMLTNNVEEEDLVI